MMRRWGEEMRRWGEEIRRWGEVMRRWGEVMRRWGWGDEEMGREYGARRLGDGAR